MSRKILSLTAVLLTFALLFGFAGCSLIPEGEEETTTEINVKTPLPTDVTSSVDEDGNLVTVTDYSPEQLAANTAEIFKYFTDTVNAVKEKKAAVNKNSRLRIEKSVDEEGNRIPYCENEYIAAAVSGIKGKFEEEFSHDYSYGYLTETIPVKEKPYVSILAPEDIESATCADNGAERTVTVVLKKPVSYSTILKAFEVSEISEITDMFKKTEQYIVVGEPEVTYTDCVITVRINVETDEVTQIRYERNADVSAPVTGAGSLEGVGEQTVKFSACSTITYDFDYTNPDEPTTL